MDCFHQSIFLICLVILTQSTYSSQNVNSGDTVMFIPGLEVRTVKSERPNGLFNSIHRQSPSSQHQILHNQPHTKSMSPSSMPIQAPPTPMQSQAMQQPMQILTQTSPGQSMSFPSQSMQQVPLLMSQQSMQQVPSVMPQQSIQQVSSVIPQQPMQQVPSVMPQQVSPLMQQQVPSVIPQQVPPAIPQQSMQQVPLEMQQQSMLQIPSVMKQELLPSVTENLQDSKNVSFGDIMEALNEMMEKREDERPEQSRAVEGRDYENSPYSNYQSSYPSYQSPPYGQRPPSYGYPSAPYPPPSYHGHTPPSYHGPSYPSPPPAYVPSHPGYGPPPPVHHSLDSKLSFLKPESTSILKPVTGKVAGKLSGLLGLILALFTGSSGDFELKGFKDLILNGIIRPLLIAKGGIKSLIGKLTIPVISLLLINLEVLVTVWWLWEDCSDTPAYSYPKPTYSYNSY